MTGSKMGQMALVYARKKAWAVFPLRERDKLPATANGFKDASSDPDTIAAMWGDREYNIGLATGAVSGVWVFDVDGDSVRIRRDRQQGRGDALVAHMRAAGRRAAGPRLTTDQILALTRG